VLDVISRIYDNDPRPVEKALDYKALFADGALLVAIEPSPLVLDDIFDSLHDKLDGTIYSGTLDDLETIEDVELRKDLMFRAHALGHCGAADMARQIKSTRRLTWPNLVKECQDFVSACLPCQRYNISRHGYHPPKNVTALLPFDRVYIDLKEMKESRKGNVYYLTLIDCAMRFVFLYPINRCIR
jgi:hypothetical protein